MCIFFYQVDGKSKEVPLNNHTTSEENNSSGLSLRTRTISSTTAPGPFHQSIVPLASSLQLNSSTVNGRKPRGRRPRRKTLNRIANKKTLQQVKINKSDEIKVCNSNLTNIKEKLATSDSDCLHQKQLISHCNGSTKYNGKLENSIKNVNLSDNIANKQSTLLPETKKNKEGITGSVYSKKYNHRKRKHVVEESVAEKRSLISNRLNDSGTQNDSIQSTSLPGKSNTEITFRFLEDSPITQSTNVKVPSSTFYGRTYWPVNWEYSAAVLTGHVQKKLSKDVLRKIRQINSVETNNQTDSLVSFKSNSTLKKSATFLQRRSTNRLAQSTADEMPSCSKQHTSPSPNIVKQRKPGRPPGKKNKLLQRIIKSNSPRKSPRQHASTLAAIMSKKVVNIGDELFKPQSDDTIDVDFEDNKKSQDIDGPCVLPIAIPKNELKTTGRHYRHRRQLDYQHSILDRRPKFRSITPPPPKLCAQEPASQRSNCINPTTVDHEVIKLRTKHVDVVKRRARDERLRSIFVCQELQKVQNVAELSRPELVADNEDYQFSVNPIPFDTSQDQIWSSLDTFGKPELDNMCLQIIYEQTNDKNFLRNSLTDETLQMYRQQRELALAERLTNNCYGDTLSSDLGMDLLVGGNKRKKKRPNMTGWPKEKRRKTIANSNTPIGDVDTFNYNRDLERRQKAAEQQRLRRRRIKLEQQQLAQEKSKLGNGPVPKRPGRRSSLKKKNNTAKSRRRTTSVSSNVTTESSDIGNYFTKPKRKYNTIRNQRLNRKTIRNRTDINLSVSKTTKKTKTTVKKKLGRPKGSLGQKKKMKLRTLQRTPNQTSTLCDQHNENDVQQPTSSGKLKCVISTRNNRMKLLSKKSSFVSSNKKKSLGNKTKKSTGACNSPSSSLDLPQASTTVVSKSARITARKKRLQQLQQTTSTNTTWDVGRPKRYISTNNRTVSNTVVEEDCCFVGSHPFEQHCPNGGIGLCQKTVFDNHGTHQKENTVHSNF